MFVWELAVDTHVVLEDVLLVVCFLVVENKSLSYRISNITDLLFMLSKVIQINHRWWTNNFMLKTKVLINKLWNQSFQDQFTDNSFLLGISLKMRWWLFNILLMNLYHRLQNSKLKKKFFIMIVFSLKLRISTRLTIIMQFRDINKLIGSVQLFGQKCNFKDTDVIFINNSTGLLREEF